MSLEAVAQDGTICSQAKVTYLSFYVILLREFAAVNYSFYIYFGESMVYVYLIKWTVDQSFY